jgi:WD40 repeat protein
MLSRHRRIILVLGFLCVLGGRPSVLAAEPDKPRLDASGEPLPAEAVQRLGSLCFRNDMNTRIATLSPDSKTIAMMGRTGVVLLDSRTGKEIKRFDYPDFAKSTGLAYSPNGKIIAVTGVKGVQLLDAESGEILGKLDVNVRDVATSLSFSTDSKRIAVGNDPFNPKRNVTVWDADGFKKLHTLEVLYDRNAQVALSSDGKLLATWGGGAANTGIPRRIQLWDMVTVKEVKEIVLEGYDVGGVALSPDGKEMAVVDGIFGSSISIWDVATAKMAHRLTARRFSDDAILRYSPDGKVLVAGTYNGDVQLWETLGYQRLGTAKMPNCTLTAVAFLPEKKVLALSLTEQALRVWEAPSGRSLSPLEGHTGPITTLQFSPDGKKLLSCGTDGVRVWNAATGKFERPISLHQSRDDRSGLPELYLLSPDGRSVLVTVQDPGKSRLLDLATQEEQYGIDLVAGHAGLKAAFSADGKMMAGITPVANPTATPDVRVWNLAAGRETTRVPLRPGLEYAVAMSPEGKFVVVGASSGELMMWDAATGKERWTNLRENQWTTHLAFSPDGRWIAAAGLARIRLIEAASGVELQRFENPDHLQINFLVFSPDGRTLAAAGTDENGQTQTGTVRLWETATAKVRVDFTAHRGTISALAFSPDGRVLASGSDDTTILLWDLTGKLNADVRGAVRPKPAEFDALWKDLNDADAAKSYRLVQRLAAYPEEAVALVNAKLPPAKPLDAVIDKMIAQLDHEEFARREQASKFLAEVGKAAEPALTKALAGQSSPEKKRRLAELLEALKLARPTPEMVRPTRALEVLERLGTPEARQLLEELGKGDKNAKLTQDAKATLKRLGAQP